VPLQDAGQHALRILVIGPAAQTLDDGESAAVAYAAEHGIHPAIDERYGPAPVREQVPATAAVQASPHNRNQT